jgi:hypothetical protein
VTPWRAVTGRARRQKRKRRPLFTCGRCGRGYSSPFGHVCAGGGDFAKRTRAKKRADEAAARREKRKADRAATKRRERDQTGEARKAENGRSRTRVAAARKAERAKAARKRPPSRPRPQRHDYRNCRDHDCQRDACEAYREGVADGIELAEAGQ